MTRERWFADGWEITEGTVRDWAYRAGSDSTTAMVGVNAVVPNRDGELWRPKQTGPASFNLDVWLAGTNRTDVELAWRTLLRAVRRPHRLVRFTRYMASGEHVYCYAELIGTIEPTYIAQKGMRASMAFSVPAGRWYSEDSYTMQTVAGAALTQTLVLTSFEPSTAPMDTLTFQVKGPITSPIVVDRTDTGFDDDTCKYDAPLTVGQTLTLDSGSWDVTGAGGLAINQSKILPTGGRLLTVNAARPGEVPTVQLRGSGGSTTTQLIVTGRRAYAC